MEWQVIAIATAILSDFRDPEEKDLEEAQKSSRMLFMREGKEEGKEDGGMIGVKKHQQVSTRRLDNLRMELLDYKW